MFSKIMHSYIYWSWYSHESSMTTFLFNWCMYILAIDIYSSYILYQIKNLAFCPVPKHDIFQRATVHIHIPKKGMIRFLLSYSLICIFWRNLWHELNFDGTNLSLFVSLLNIWLRIASSLFLRRFAAKERCCNNGTCLRFIRCCCALSVV